MEDEGREYRWETGYEKTWEVIQEDDDGFIECSVQEMLEKAKRKRLLEKSGARIKLGMMRHVFIVLDQSDAMKLQDLKPTRLICAAKLLEDFLEEFFHLNPISQIGLITTQNKRAELVSELAGNPRKHTEHLEKLVTVASNQSANVSLGEPSLQNSIEIALQSLRHIPPHASREIIVIMGSLTTCDPGDITTTLASCKALNVRCSVISLAAEVRIFRELAHTTGGEFNVSIDDVHFRDLLNAQLEPPPTTAATEPSLIKMGFPCHAGGGDFEDGARGSSGLGMCMCHLDRKSVLKPTMSGFLCPQCQAKYCELPAECKCCGLTLVSAPHLARSYHHLFPLPAFKEVEFDVIGEQTCFSCIRRMTSSKRDPRCYQCPDCKKIFCSDCDLFAHESLHSCPGCAAMPKYHQTTNGKSNG